MFYFKQSFLSAQLFKFRQLKFWQFKLLEKVEGPFLKKLHMFGKKKRLEVLLISASNFYFLKNVKFYDHIKF